MKSRWGRDLGTVSGGTVTADKHNITPRKSCGHECDPEAKLVREPHSHSWSDEQIMIRQASGLSSNRAFELYQNAIDLRLYISPSPNLIMFHSIKLCGRVIRSYRRCTLKWAVDI